jgi:thiol:disulfide interchange protein
MAMDTPQNTTRKRPSRAAWAVWLTMSGAVLVGCRTSPLPEPQIYDPVADGESQLVAALNTANRTNRRVLLNLGANWCSDSQKMYRLLHDDPGIAPLVQSNYVLVLVDVNERSGMRRNAALVERLGTPLEKGIPVLLVIDSNGRVLNSGPSQRLRDSDHKRPRKVERYLRQWAQSTTPLDAQTEPK